MRCNEQAKRKESEEHKGAYSSNKITSTLVANGHNAWLQLRRLRRSLRIKPRGTGRDYPNPTARSDSMIMNEMILK